MSDKKQRLLDMIGSGLTVGEAARRLDLSVRTAEPRLAEARRTLGATTNAQALLRARGRVPVPVANQRLTRRELEVLQLVAEGFRAPEIAERLGIARSTVATVLRSAMARLGLRSRTQAAAKLAEMTWVPSRGK